MQCSESTFQWGLLCPEVLYRPVVTCQSTISITKQTWNIRCTSRDFLCLLGECHRPLSPTLHQTVSCSLRGSSKPAWLASPCPRYHFRISVRCCCLVLLQFSENKVRFFNMVESFIICALNYVDISSVIISRTWDGQCVWYTWGRQEMQHFSRNTSVFVSNLSRYSRYVESTLDSCSSNYV
jgi:hypothetical protein